MSTHALCLPYPWRVLGERASVSTTLITEVSACRVLAAVYSFCQLFLWWVRPYSGRHHAGMQCLGRARVVPISPAFIIVHHFVGRLSSLRPYLTPPLSSPVFPMLPTLPPAPYKLPLPYPPAQLELPPGAGHDDAEPLPEAPHVGGGGGAGWGWPRADNRAVWGKAVII